MLATDINRHLDLFTDQLPEQTDVKIVSAKIPEENGWEPCEMH